MKAWVAVLGWVCIGSSTAGRAASLLLISVDGLKPEYVLEAPAHGLKLPYLRGMMDEGTYADGVVGVWPTITYPSHTTLVTGVTPAAHGIQANLEFDPERHFKDAWYWYGSRIKVPTLWQAAHARGLRTASVGWPVTVGAPGIDYLIPEYWRIAGRTTELDPADRELLAALARPEGLLPLLRPTAGDYMAGNDTTPEGDEIKTRYTIELIRRFKPALVTLHLSSLDDAEHGHGVFSSEANHTVETLDAMLSRLATAARAADPSAVVMVVSDHGFMPILHEVNLYAPFIDAGLMTLTEDAGTQAAKVASWRAEPWLAGGMAAIMLHDPQDSAAREAVGQLLRTLAAEPRNGIDAVLDRAAMQRRGGFPDAEFVVVFKAGYYAGAKTSGDLVTDVVGDHGSHGFSPDQPAMRASFFASGTGVARHRDLGVIDMRQIAPTAARLLGVALPAASAPPLTLTP